MHKGQDKVEVENAVPQSTDFINKAWNKKLVSTQVNSSKAAYMQATIKEERELHKNPYENSETAQNKQCVTRLPNEDCWERV